jgi:hypothetical protein
MNRECYADIFIIHKERFLRCFGNGKFIKIKRTFENDEPCPICKRPLNIHGRYRKPKTRTIDQVWHPEFKTWMNIL